MWSFKSCQLALWGKPVTTVRNSVCRPGDTINKERVHTHTRKHNTRDRNNNKNRARDRTSSRQQTEETDAAHEIHAQQTERRAAGIDGVRGEGGGRGKDSERETC